jgi:hypothetical protein
MESQESSLLAFLIGDSTYSASVAAVPRFLSLGEEPTKNVMALLTPVILGVLGSQQRLRS